MLPNPQNEKIVSLVVSRGTLTAPVPFVTDDWTEMKRHLLFDRVEKPSKPQAQ